jgi:hypothetical protein
MPGTVVRNEFRRASLWFALIGGGGAWMIHLLAAYAIAEFGCVSGLGDRLYGDLSVIAWMQIALTAATTLMAGAATAVAYRRHRELQSIRAVDATLVAERSTATSGLLASGLFTFVILFESIPILFYLHDC